MLRTLTSCGVRLPMELPPGDYYFYERPSAVHNHIQKLQHGTLWPGVVWPGCGGLDVYSTPEQRAAAAATMLVCRGARDLPGLPKDVVHIIIAMAFAPL